MKILLLFVGCLPSFLQRPIRRLLGARIHPSAKLRPFSFIMTTNLQMGPRSQVGPFVFAKVAGLSLGERVAIRPFVILKTRKIAIGDYSIIDPLVLINCNYGPRSELKVGRHCRILSFSMLEPSEGIFLGDHVVIGGQGLIFCHGSWSNYLEGSPWTAGPVHIGNQVWISWRSMIMAGTHIGDRAMIGAHSMVHGRVPANSFYAGVPARMVLENIWKTLTTEERKKRMDEIIESFSRDHDIAQKTRIQFIECGEPNELRPMADQETIIYSFEAIPLLLPDSLPKGRRVTVLDLRKLIAYSDSDIGREFIDHINSYGVRLDLKSILELKEKK